MIISLLNGQEYRISTMITMYISMRTGFSAAIALSDKILNEGEPAVRRYLNFLCSGCTKDPVSLLRDAGVDMSGPEPVETALKLFNSLMDEMEELLLK